MSTIKPVTNQVQRRYASDRVSSIVRDHSIVIKEDCENKKRTVPDRDEKCRMIREGEAVFHPERVYTTSGRYNVPDIIECYEFPTEAEIFAHNEEIDRLCQQRIYTLHDRASVIRDQIMLGNDVDEALRLITEFSESKF